MTDDEPSSLEDVLDCLEEVDSRRDEVPVSLMIELVGARSFGPLLLVIGLFVLSPIGDIPGTPTIMALVIFLIAGQLLFGRTHFWLPGWILRRSVSRRRFEKSLRFLRRPVRFIDRFFHRRLTVVFRYGNRPIAAQCVFIAMLMPVLEFVPFSSTGAGMALSAFGLALVACDGLLALMATFVTLATAAAAAWFLLLAA